MQWKWQLAQSLEKRWWKQYLGGKNPEEYLHWKRAYWEGVWQMTGWEQPRDLQVVDAGCGPAGIFIWLQACEVFAFDPLLDAYQAFAPTLQAEEFPWVRFRQTSLEEMGPGDGLEFDLVCCTNALNHVRSLEKATENLVRMGRKRSRFLLTLDVHRTRLGKWMLQSIPLDVLHPQQGRLEDYLSLLESRKLESLRVEVIRPGKGFDHALITGIKPYTNG